MELALAALDQLVPVYLKTCEVEGKTERTVQSYALLIEKPTDLAEELAAFYRKNFSSRIRILVRRRSRCENRVREEIGCYLTDQCSTVWQAASEPSFH